MAHLWKLFIARRSLSQIVKLILSGVSQMVIQSNKRAAMRLSRENYLQLTGYEKGIVLFFRASPLGEAVRAGDITLIREPGGIREVDF